MSIKYIVEAYRWFDKINGNTYHTVYITDTKTKNLVYASDTMVYGYGEQYRHTAYDGLIKKGLFKNKDRFNHELIRDMFYFNCTDVSRKRDLFQ